ncbi:recombinase family protein [Nonomuraea aridisoli]|nr:recombinase family protein [Nonomuraea aridisoli]
MTTEEQLAQALRTIADRAENQDVLPGVMAKRRRRRRRKAQGALTAVCAVALGWGAMVAWPAPQVIVDTAEPRPAQPEGNAVERVWPQAVFTMPARSRPLAAISVTAVLVWGERGTFEVYDAASKGSRTVAALGQAPQHLAVDRERVVWLVDGQAWVAQAAGVTRVFSEKISTRATTRPELDKAVALARELRSAGVAVTLVVHEHKRLGRGLDLAALAEQLRAASIGLEFLTGELQGSHDPSGVVFTVLAALSGMEREYIRDRTLEGHESARARGKTIGGAAVTDEAMLSMALHLREQNLSLRDIAARLVITKGKKKGRPPFPATVLRMLRDHDAGAAAAPAAG